MLSAAASVTAAEAVPGEPKPQPLTLPQREQARARPDMPVKPFESTYGGIAENVTHFRALLE